MSTTFTADTRQYCDAGCGEPATLRCVRCLAAFYCGKSCQDKEPCKVTTDELSCKKNTDTKFDEQLAKTRSLSEPGTGVAVDKLELKAMTLAADAEHSNEAKFRLGLCYQNGDGVEVNHIEAVKWFALAATMGDANSQCSLGNAYFSGDGVDAADRSEAIKWWKLAAEGGSEKAQTLLGLISLSPSS